MKQPKPFAARGTRAVQRAGADSQLLAGFHPIYTSPTGELVRLALAAIPKALKASFPPDQWPATEITESDGTMRFVLKNGTEIHRIGILRSYDYQTGKLVGHLGPRRRFVRLAADPAMKAAPSKAGDVCYGSHFRIRNKA